MSHAIRRLTASLTISLAALGLAMAPAHAAPAPIPQNADPCITVCITQVSTGGSGGRLDQFIELKNISIAPVDVTGYTLWGCPVSGSLEFLLRLPPGLVFEPGQFYLIADPRGYTRATPPDQLGFLGLQRLGGLQLRGAPTPANPRGPIIDEVGFSVGNRCTETAPAAAQSPAFIDQSVIRVSPIDTNVNAFDFVLISPAFPRNSSF